MLLTDNIVHVKAFIQDDRWCRLHDMPAKLDLLKLVTNKITHEKLNYHLIVFQNIQLKIN